jgi:hypothetical protein
MTGDQPLIQRPIEPGDIVRLSYGFADRSGTGEYEVVRLMPMSVSGELAYRVRGADGHERAIGHGQILAQDIAEVSPLAEGAAATSSAASPAPATDTGRADHPPRTGSPKSLKPRATAEAAFRELVTQASASDHAPSKTDPDN